MAKIIGNTTATPNPRPDWAQTDENKADYIKNKPTILTEEDVLGLISDNGGGGATNAKDIAYDGEEEYISATDVETALKLTSNMLVSFSTQFSAKADADHTHYADEIYYLRLVDGDPVSENVGEALGYLFNHSGSAGSSDASDISVAGGEESYTGYGATVQEAVETFDQRFGDIEVALDDIIAIQEDLIIPNGDEVSY